MPGRHIDLVEYEPLELARDEFPDDVGFALWRDYKDKVRVEFPGPPTGHRWRLTALGWVGFIPLGDGWDIAIMPKVGVSPGNVFAMLEYAYGLRSFHLLAGLVGADSLDAFFERLANVLARRILGRVKQGLHRRYVEEDDELLAIRGRIDVAAAVRAPWAVRLPCSFEEHTSDIEDNRILAWTLRQILRNDLCSPRIRPTVVRAFRATASAVTLLPIGPEACVGRSYDRLNEDYRVLHALCRFFLENMGPSHERAERKTLPFLVAMDLLFEKFVAEWMKEHLHESASLQVRAQERYQIVPGRRDLHFNIDITLNDRRTGRAQAVLDTKYKAASVPSAEDIAQVVAYATAKGCTDAILVFPTESDVVFPESVGPVRVQRVEFRLDGDLQEGGLRFLAALPGSPT